MKQRKLNYRFHDPNPAVATAGYILRIFIEVNQEKVRQAMQAAADKVNSNDKEKYNGCPVP